MVSASSFSPVHLPPLLRGSLALAFFLSAGAFAFPAFSAFADAKTTISPVAIETATKLVTTGIYGVTRNPMYVALTFLLCSWASWIGQPLPLIGPVVFAIYINRFQIQPEERVLLAKFGQIYSNYQSSVRRWL
jgi:protein-S-isoprenylcysteine O-methyltransferase Ste14